MCRRRYRLRGGGGASSRLLSSSRLVSSPDAVAVGIASAAAAVRRPGQCRRLAGGGVRCGCRRDRLRGGARLRRSAVAPSPLSPVSREIAASVRCQLPSLSLRVAIAHARYVCRPANARVVAQTHASSRRRRNMCVTSLSPPCLVRRRAARSRLRRDPLVRHGRLHRARGLRARRARPADGSVLFLLLFWFRAPGPARCFGVASSPMRADGVKERPRACGFPQASWGGRCKRVRVCVWRRSHLIWAGDVNASVRV